MKIDPDAAGLDADRLERITEHLAAGYVDPGKIAGCQALVARGGHVGYLRSLGSMDREDGRPVVDDAIWRIYSMTKPVTAVALLTLYERGRFHLADPVHRFIPEWRDLKVAERAEDGSTHLVDPHRPMTVRDLLMHTSGLGYEARGPVELGGDPDSPALAAGATLDTAVQWLADRPLHSHPGTRWRYSVSTDICGHLVERISGVGFDEYLRAEVLDPLGMVDTRFAVADDDLERFAAGYRRDSRKRLVRFDDPRHTHREPVTYLAGGSGLVSTTADYLRFCQMLLGGGELHGRRILGRTTVDLMTRNHLPGDADLGDLADGYGRVGFDGMGFGLTVTVAKGPERTLAPGSPGHYSWGGFASTIFWVDPAEELIVIFMTQLVPTGTFGFRDQLKALVYPCIVD